MGGPKRQRILLKGEVASPIEPGDVCRFMKRCQYACEDCKRCSPALQEISEGHYVACHLFGENR